MADLGGHPGRGDDHLPTAPGDRSVHIAHADAVAQCHLITRHRFDDLPNRQALTGQGGFLNLQGCSNHYPAVRGDQVAGLHQDNVPWHQFFGLHLEHLAIAPNSGNRLQHRGEGGDALLGLRLLTQANDRIEKGEPGQDHGGGGVSCHQLVH